ncbi:hypothetical protein GIB67_016749 [Kingdonia uniflora]|uniref:Mediator of RNA polymerase II transcription subunit 20 n=1 Tax=Kingdonia uniflora TaxID=39325 RepID=A0A7J7M5S7_9MAGN|nr:hypothetical protein GIB67_016749 [Kingdonia uniflora]
MALPFECSRDLMGISLQEQPNKLYFVIRSQRIVLEADSMIQMIMDSYSLIERGVRLLSRFGDLPFGYQYQLGDFQLRVGKVIPNSQDNLRELF